MKGFAFINNRAKEESDFLVQNYHRYIREISTADMAASYECVALLDRICKSGSCKKLLDFGSGFSSYVFRQNAVLDPEICVWSVEDDERWIEKTQSFLHANDVSSENLIMLESFLAETERDFDLVFLDLNFVDVRKNFIRLAVERCKSGGFIIFDDVHKNEFLYEILLRTKDLPVRLFNIKDLTLDRFGRFALLGIKD